MIVDTTSQTIVSSMLTEFAFRIDSGSASTNPELCTEGFSFGTPTGSLDLDAFKQAMFQRQAAPHRSRHRISNIRVLERSESSIVASAMMSVTRIEPQDDNEEKSTVVLVDCNMTIEQIGSDYKFSHLELLPFVTNEYVR